MTARGFIVWPDLASDPAARTYEALRLELLANPDALAESARLAEKARREADRRAAYARVHEHVRGAR